MESIKIDILNPKAKKLLQNLADLKLIKIKKSDDRKADFFSVVSRLRKKADSAPSLDDISKEVEAVRKKLYGK